MKTNYLTHHLACFQTVSCISSELFPCKLIKLPTVLLRLFSHEEEAPAFEVPRLDLLVINCHNSLQDKEGRCVEGKLEEELHNR